MSKLGKENLKLPEDDVRAQEMIFWLKKLSLELPEAAKSRTDTDIISGTVNRLADRIQILETVVRTQHETVVAIV